MNLDDPVESKEVAPPIVRMVALTVLVMGGVVLVVGMSAAAQNNLAGGIVIAVGIAVDRDRTM